jgi:NADH dehydrogenase
MKSPARDSVSCDFLERVKGAVIRDRKSEPLPRVVIVGGGFAGLAVADELVRCKAEVTLIDRNNHHLFQPLLYQVATAALPPGDIAVPIRGVLRKQENTTVLMGRVSRIDVGEQIVWVGERSCLYDYLVVASGVETNYFGHHECDEFAPGLKTIEEAVEVRARFLLALEEAELEVDESARRSASTFAIVGAGPAGVEMAAALAEIVASVHGEFRRVDTERLASSWSMRSTGSWAPSIRPCQRGR